MYRDGKRIITSDVHNFVLNHGALGDIITSLPAIVYAGQRYGDAMNLRVWAPPWQMELIAHLLAPYGKFEVLDLTKFPLEKTKRADWDGGPSSLNAAIHDTHTRCRVHMVDYAFNFLLNAQPGSMLERSYPTAAKLGERSIFESYVVFPVGATSDNKLFRAKVMTPVLEWCLSKGYCPVFVGTKTSHTQTKMGATLAPIVIREESDQVPREVFGRCMDLREKTTLLELRDVLGHAKAVVGVDGGTLHLAGTTNVPIVFASGTTLPKHRYVPRNGDPNHRIRYVGVKDLECYGCQSNWPLTSLHFAQCAYGDNKCMDMLDPEDFINGLKELGL